MGAKTAEESERWFDRYVTDHGHDPGEPEPDLGVEKKPDRLIQWNGVEVVCEIKQFNKDPLGSSNQTKTIDMKTALKPVRKAIGRAAKQLKPLEGTDRPLVVVLANPNLMPVPLSTDEILCGVPPLRWTSAD